MKTVVENMVRLNAPAKINLTLAVLGRRADGYHELESWVMLIDWHDEIELSPADTLELDFDAGDADIPRDGSNLVAKAARAMAAASARDPDVHILLRKRLPLGAGLGGGSSDAAAVISGLNELWALHWQTDRLAAIGSAVGSDVALFLYPPAAVMRGRGERIEPLGRTWSGWVALIAPPFHLSTAAVYHAFQPVEPSTRRVRQPWRQTDMRGTALADQLFNDLEPAAFACEPRLAALHSALDGLRGRRVRMTGSGSCLFALFDEKSEADSWRNAALGLAINGTEIQVVRTL